jgi:hypothetical protein
MQVFVRHLACFLIIQGCIWGGVLALYRQYKAARFEGTGGEYLAVSIDKHHLLVQQPSRRIVFVGGSNLAFGLDSAEIERALGYHPINMGLDAGLGLDFMLQEVEPFLKPGDVVVLSPEYEHFIDWYRGDIETLFAEIENQPRSIRFLTFRNLALFLDQGLVVIGDITRKSISFLNGGVHVTLEQLQNSPYRPSGFNRFGDVIAHYHLAPKAFLVTKLKQPTPTSISQVINRLNKFNNRCRRNAILVFYSYPPIFQGQLQENAAIIHEIAVNLSQRLNFPLLDTPEEMSFPLDYFFDLAYHLNVVGIQIRTGHLIEKLRDRLPEPSSDHV